VADVYQALCEKRPYRDSLPTKVVFGIMAEDASTRLDLECMTALRERRPEEAVKTLAQAAGA
jgi:HD-GYP domain-containing protein (c-di-GMP phosphodiesterase class II)